MLKKHTILLLFVSAMLTMRSGVYILTDLPKAVGEIVREAQESMTQKVAELNKEEGTEYLFQSAQFAPHLSLAFVSQEELPIRAAEKKFAGIEEALQAIAGKHLQIDISSNFKDAAIDYWPGKFEVECGGAKKKNYVNVVFKASNNPELVNLANAITTMLKEKYNIEQRFPFSTHITIGRICEKHDKPLDGALRQKLEKLEVGSKKLSQRNKQIAISLGKFKLKGHDGSDITFALATQAKEFNQGATQSMLKEAYVGSLNSAGQQNEGALERYLQQGADINAKGLFGNTGLNIGIQKHSHVFEAFLENGANPNIKNDAGWTPLMYAAKGNESRFVTQLLEHGANPYMKNPEGQTALDIAQQYPKNLKVLNDFIAQHQKALQGVSQKSLEPRLYALLGKKFGEDLAPAVQEFIGGKEQTNKKSVALDEDKKAASDSDVVMKLED